MVPDRPPVAGNASQFDDSGPLDRQQGRVAPVSRGLALCWTPAPRDVAGASPLMCGCGDLDHTFDELPVMICWKITTFWAHRVPRRGARHLPNQEAYRSVIRHPETLAFPGLLIWRAGGDLFLASIGHLNEGLKAALASSRPPAKHILLDADSVNFIDASACDAPSNVIRQLQSQGITFAFARVRGSERAWMRRAGIEAVVDRANFHEPVIDGVRAWQQREGVERRPRHQIANDR